MAHSTNVVHHDALNTEPTREVLADRIKRLQTEARRLAREHIQLLQGSLAEMERLAADIAEGGEAYPVGVREIARRLADDCTARFKTLEVISTRS